MLAKSALGAQQASPLRVVVLGHTGRGNYGHGLDTVWLRVPETRIVALSDPDLDGRRKAQERLGGVTGFGSYRQMFESVTAEVAAVCPRQPDQHADMALAAIAAGVRGLYVEKPFCRTPAEADKLVAACRERGVKLAVAHRNRYHPAIAQVRDFIHGGGLGTVLELRGRGKGDRRGGGEDLWVLGSHVMNLIHYFGGPAVACSALLRQGGKLVTREHVRPGNEALGPLAGDEVHARFELEGGWVAYFDSVANDGTEGAAFGLQVIGSKGVIDIDCDRDPVAHFAPGNPFQRPRPAREWVPITSAGVGVAELRPDIPRDVANHVIPARDLLRAISEDSQPKCSARDGAATVEMICAVFASHAAGGKRVRLPLEDRGNALARL